MEFVTGALAAIAPWIADALVIIGIFGMTVGIYGMLRMPDVYNKLHASSKVVFLGVMMLLLASAATNEAEIVYRVLLIGVFLVLTTPVAAHVIGKAAFLRSYKMEAPDAIDESEKGLNRRSGSDD